MTVESIYVIAIATLSDWLKRLAPVSSKKERVLLSFPQSQPFVMLRVVVVVFLVKNCDCTEIKKNRQNKSCEGMGGDGDPLKK